MGKRKKRLTIEEHMELAPEFLKALSIMNNLWSLSAEKYPINSRIYQRICRMMNHIEKVRSVLDDEVCGECTKRGDKHFRSITGLDSPCDMYYGTRNQAVSCAD